MYVDEFLVHSPKPLGAQQHTVNSLTINKCATHERTPNRPANTMAAALTLKPCCECQDNKSLLATILRGHAKCLRAFLQGRPLVEDRGDENGDTLLSHAVKALSVECVKALLAAGASANVMNFNRFTPVALAAQCGHDGIIRLLHGAGANVNHPHNVHNPYIPYNPHTPIVLAARGGHPRTVQALVEFGADVHTPILLNLAATSNCYACVATLLESGMNVNNVTGGVLMELHWFSIDQIRTPNMRHATQFWHTAQLLFSCTRTNLLCRMLPVRTVRELWDMPWLRVILREIAWRRRRVLLLLRESCDMRRAEHVGVAKKQQRKYASRGRRAVIAFNNVYT